MLEFVQATKEDIVSVTPQTAQDNAAAVDYGRSVFDSGQIPLEGKAVAIKECGHCVGAYGLVDMWPGVARVWAIFSEDLIADHPLLLGLHVARDLKRADHDGGFRRIEATTGTTHDAGADFLEFLGFKLEGRMRRYDVAGNDTYLYARVHDEC